MGDSNSDPVPQGTQIPEEGKPIDQPPTSQPEETSSASNLQPKALFADDCATINDTTQNEEEPTKADEKEKEHEEKQVEEKVDNEEITQKQEDQAPSDSLQNTTPPKTPERPSGSKEGDELVGVTYEGERFVVPSTTSPFALTHGRKSNLTDYLKWSPALINLILLLLPLPKWFFVANFIIWRLGYDVGLGYLLHHQSKSFAITRYFAMLTHPEATFYGIIKKLVSLNMGPEYDFKAVPQAFNAWLGWRLVADWVLAMDFFSYVIFCLRMFEVTEITGFVLACYILGIILCGFSLWAKLDAYRVVEDYAWYWGDFFFLLDRNLTFDRVFSISPHPMYTIGYTFYYGASLLTQSYTVLYVSLVAHIAQLLFLNLVEEPHMKKIYSELVSDPDPRRTTILYDKVTGYFRKDLIVFYNFNVLRSSDIFMLVIIFYCVLTIFFDIHPVFYIFQVIAWRIAHSFGLGYILYCQSKDKKWILYYFEKGYTKQEAFDNWKRVYNLSLTMTWVSFICCAIKFYDIPDNLFQNAGLFWLLQTFGLVLIAINIWSSVSTFEVLGEFGWFYGDFFLDEVKAKLYYTGIYRFLNNPEVVTGFAGYYGIALMASSPAVFALALFSHWCNWVFIAKVERQHMQNLYGDQVRDKSGLTSAVRQIMKETIDEATPKLKRLPSAIESKTKELTEKTKEFLENVEEAIEEVLQRKKKNE